MTGSIDGLYCFPHPFGCSQTGADHAQIRKLLAALAKHPNAGAVLVLGLGCENLTREQFIEELGDFDPDRKHEIAYIAQCILPDIIALYESEEGQKEFQEWKAQREAEVAERKDGKTEAT